MAAIEPLIVTRVRPGGPAAEAGVTEGMAISAPLTSASALRMWREAYRHGPMDPVQLTDQGTQRLFTWQPQAVWQVDPDTRDAWLRLHLAALLQMAGFLAGAVLLMMLGTRGMTATLMTLALIFTAMANGGPLFGAEFSIPVISSILLLFGWMATAVSFPIIGLAVLHFPTRAAVLDRHRWIVPALYLLPAPVLVVSLVSAAYLLGMDAALGPLEWFATNGWLFDASFGAALRGQRGDCHRRHPSLPDQCRRDRTPADSNRCLYRRPGGLRVRAQSRPAARAVGAWPAHGAAVADRGAAAGDHSAPRVCVAVRRRGEARVQPADRIAAEPAIRVRPQNPVGVDSRAGGTWC